MIRTSIVCIVLLASPLILICQTFSSQSVNLELIGSYGMNNSEGGGGLSLADFNSDGLDDISFATAAGFDPIFYINRGSHFEKVLPPYVSNTGEGKQIIWVDYDADGFKDIFIASEDSANRLYKNDGNFNFTDVSAAVGLFPVVEKTYGANFGDLNSDGSLELYITNYESDNMLYTYDPSLDYFVDITASANVANGTRATFDAIFFDSDLDGDLDIYVVNDKAGDENTLYMNIGSNTFVDISVPSNTNIDLFSMNAGVADYNLDGLLDIYITSQDNAVLLENQGGNIYTDVANTADVELAAWAWTGNFIDYDNDNDKDLYVSIEFSTNNRPNAFLVNNGNETFIEPFEFSNGLAGVDGFSSFVNAIGDFDNNGFLDIMNYKAEVLGVDIFLNHTNNNSKSFKLDLQGSLAHQEAWGSRVEVVLTDGTILVDHKHCSESFLSQNSEYMHFGLNNNQIIDFINVFWPSSTGIETIQGLDITLGGLNKIIEASGVTEFTPYRVCFDSGFVKIDPLSSQLFGAENVLNYEGTVMTNTTSILKSETEVSLEIGFEVNIGADLEILIDTCDN